MKNVNVEEILSKAQEMQGQFKQMQDAFSQKEINVTIGIKDVHEIWIDATIDGMRQVKKIVIGKGAIEQGAEALADLIKDAINKATIKLNEEMQKEVQSIYKSSGLPTNPGDAGDDTTA